MSHHNWLVTDDGQYHTFGHPNVSAPGQYYRLYRFLTDIEDILATFHDDISRLEAITPLVRKLLTSSYWLQTTYQTPDTEKGWATHTLYQEPDFPLTLHMAAWLPGYPFPPHTYDTWGILAIVSGQDHHGLWHPLPQMPSPIKPDQDLILNPGDVLAFTRHTTHRICPKGDSPTVALGLYGAPRVAV
ncbi:MAG: cupin [Spirulina sp.]